MDAFGAGGNRLAARLFAKLPASGLSLPREIA
jgi:hypothetical protein